MSDFRAASPGSRAFKARLVELTAVAIHEIAVELFNLNLRVGNHEGDHMATWVPRMDDDFWKFYDEFWPTLFRHAWYKDYDQYPSSIADGVGFWAEARILGGVVLFDRRGPEGDPDSVWFHSNNRDVTYRLYQLREDQRLQLLDFLNSETPDLKLLPIHGDRSNEIREDPEEAVEAIGIYRHRWERRPLAPGVRDGRLTDVFRRFQYPRRSDFDRAGQRAVERRNRLEDEEWEKARAEEEEDTA